MEKIKMKIKLYGGKKFDWTHCSEPDTHKRLSIKEQSLEIGLNYCKELMNTINEVFENIARHSEQSAELIWSQEDRKEWISQCPLNALLGYRELLPTNNEEASTAVQCKVIFNHDVDPENAFRCQVTFQSKENLEDKIQQFLKDLKIKQKLEDEDSGSPEDEQALRDFESVLQPTREIVSIVFGLQDDQVEELGVDGVLKSNPEALKLLGTKKILNSSNADEISKKMKPYMDSTVADHSTSGASFAAWPLIEQVELFVKSDILRNGVVLVDLPGLGDAVESRALVAERSFDQLTATLIVAQATRAADNSTAVGLMSMNQEVAMMMDGTLHKETFCVCLSQIDQIDRKAALRKPDAKANVDLQLWLEEEEAHKITVKAKLKEQKLAKKAMKKLRTAMKKQQKSRKETVAKVALRRLKEDKRAQKLILAKVSQEITRSKRDLTEADGKITFTCIQARNEYLRDRIRSDFKKRQARLVAKTGIQPTYDGQVAVCPTSAKAFWDCKNEVKRTTGFPSEAYTGIPGLASWIRSATVPKREEHVNELLNRLQAQFNIIKLWSEDKSKLADLVVTKESFENDILADVLKTTEHKLREYWPQLEAKVAVLNPLPDKKESLSECPKLCNAVVRGWAYRKPDDKTSSDRVHWTTYQASLSRLGAKFVSKSKAIRQEYNWMQDVSRIMYEIIVKDWDLCLNRRVPSLINDARPVIDEIWDEFVENLHSKIQEVEPRLLSDFVNEKHGLDIIKASTKTSVHKALKGISTRASLCHPLISCTIQREWQEAFQAALEITGTGSYIARQTLLLDFANNKSEVVFRKVYEDLQKRLQANFDELPKALNSVTERVVHELRRYIGVLLDKVLQPDSDLAHKMEAVSEQKKRLQVCVQTAPLQWTLEWGFLSPGHCVIEGKASQELPEQYQHAQTELERLEDDDSEQDSESDSDTYSDTSGSGGSGDGMEFDGLPRGDSHEVTEMQY
ncbi:hypothetical protein F5X98DRAFT_363502 [Xylaria grammica]|nr:hypothetical protein F5X98DRAFT_363502 [Xylaria grammica]